MKKTYDKETGTRTWHIDKLHQKIAYVYGAFVLTMYVVVFTLTMLVVFVAALAS